MSEVFELNHRCFRSAHATESSVPVGLGHPPHTLSLAEVGIVLGEARVERVLRRFGRGDLTRKHGKQGRTITRNGESRLAELLLRPGTVSGKRRVGPGHRLLRNPDASSSY